MITNSIYADGFGENFKFIIYTIIYAEYLNKDFFYTPLNNKIEHNYNNDTLFVDKKEIMINLKKHYPLIKLNINYDKPDRLLLLNFFENNTEFCLKSKSLNKLKNIFKESNIDKFDKKYFNIAIHIRRENKFDTEKLNNSRKFYDIIPGTDVPIELYKDIIIQLKQYKNYKIHVYSQGDESDFNFVDDITLHLNEELEHTFVDLVFADVLVIAPSSLSYSAALLSENIVYYIKSCHKPFSTWKEINNYTSTKNRYMFFIKISKDKYLEIFYDTKIGKFYKEYYNNENVLVIEYINIYDYLIN